MKKFYYLFFYAFLLGAVSLGVTACGDDDDDDVIEPTPENVENPLNTTAYYIIGKVTDGSSALSGVAVSTSGQSATTADDGTFELKVTAKGDYTLAYAKSGYVSVSGIATVASDAASNSSVSVTQQLVKQNDPVTVSEEGATITEANNENLTMEIPAGAVASATAITITEFAEGSKKVADGQIRLGLVTINCEPDGLTFEKPVTVYLKTGAGNKARFANPRHYIEKNGVWTDAGAAGYDEEKQAYTLTLTGFSNHSLNFLATISITGTSSEALGTVEIDNLGNMSAVSADVSTTQKIGWEVDGSVSSIVSAALSGLSETEVSDLVALINASLVSAKGNLPGVTERALALGTAQLSGDMKVVYSFASLVQNANYVFTVIYDGAETSITVPVKTYLGTATTTTYTFGDTQSQHSGGGGE